ncbi:6-phosphogluconate dehydrogenase C-terminal domain-like protein [Punctularia strigosozonata HHB-11173 SS5]|uniref:6-phosphogluconate dehydrogenase C-terminal domain-like protein n=1 Tax=Punctularia strigosozonata (strain HHB-11173) TaxID=741275 RepID=UPI000441700B|nr:6-phosphogluconate dehydrogenase C-terminal domain-like protein [Punctularia strigosozonata HHB-11173 SS5]EIN10485.1 6-phosphogluconate dehydrogenase C-terminal domain-like protein [Punctularia strigosozonata HHB-11173 SS5]
MQDVLLIGMGGVGATYARVLERAGAHVTAIARGSYEAIQSTGLDFVGKAIEEQGGEIKAWRPYRVFRDLGKQALDRSYSYVVIATKAIPEVQTVAQLVAPLLSPEYTRSHPQPVFVLLQNGLNVERDLYEALQGVKCADGQPWQPKIISAAVYVAVNLIGRNTIQHNQKEFLNIGVYRMDDYSRTENDSEEAQLLGNFTQLLREGGSTANIFPEIQRLKFKKNILNCVFSSFSALSGYTLHSVFRKKSDDPAQLKPVVDPITAPLIDEHAIPTIRAIIDEVVDVGRAYGFPDTEETESGVAKIADGVFRRMERLHTVPDSKNIVSMLLDVQNSRPIEVECIVGEVVRMAHAKGVPIPRLEVLYALLLVKQNQLLQGVRAPTSRGKF